MSDTGGGRIGVEPEVVIVVDAATLTVIVVIVGAVHASAEQSQEIGLIVTEIVEVVPALAAQSAKVTTIESVVLTYEEIWLPYTDGSIVSLLPEPSSAIVAHVVIVVPPSLIS